MEEEKKHFILRRFPNKRDTLTRLMAEDSEFLDLCEDYDACVIALRHWTASNAPESASRADEYATLVRELKEEIEETITGLNS